MDFVEAKFAQLFGNDLGSTGFLESGLRMGMNVPPPSGHFVVKARNSIDDRHRRAP
jgi:hypothetical protein